MTLRQALSGQWQMPLFIAGMVVLAAVLWQMRPREEKPLFEQQYKYLEWLAQENRFHDFFGAAEQVRLAAETETQLGQVHGLVAQTRVKQLRQKRELCLDVYQHRSARVNYENIIKDFNEALHRNWVDPNGPASAPIYYDMSLAYWGLNDSEKAVLSLNRAIEVSEKFDSILYRALVQMLLTSRPKGYLGNSYNLLESILGNEESTVDDKAWAFVRKIEVLITQGNEKTALALLNSSGKKLEDSKYRDEIVLLRGRALRHAGYADEADLILRKLLSQLTERGDVYAQVCLELGKINYEQYRDQDAREFFTLVTVSQVGKDWYVAGTLGLAECAAMQQRYDEAINYYQETVDLLKQNGPNRAVDSKQVQASLALLAEHLALLKQYNTALSFLDIEQKIAPEDDIKAAERFGRMHYREAMLLLAQEETAKREGQESSIDKKDEEWVRQQQKLISTHFDQAAEQFLRVSQLAVDEDELYGQSLWQAALCFDKAGNAEKAIETWERFVDQREGKTRWPRALFYLAQAHQSLGHYDEAITYYRTLLHRHPHSPAAFDSIVPLARCYLAEEPVQWDKAEELLLSVLNNRALTPEAPYFRQALFELGELYFHNQNYPQAITRLIEAIDRYPKEPGLGKYLFLVGDSYRQSGLKLDDTLDKLSEDPADTVSREKTSNRKRQHLKKALEYFSMAVDFYEHVPEDRRNQLDNLYLRHSWIYRGDCLFDLGMYQQAVLLYEEVALRYQLTPTALMAFIQIVNCHVKMNNPVEAASANRRAIWQLTKMTDAALTDNPIALSRKEWQQWFHWTDNAGLW